MSRQLLERIELLEARSGLTPLHDLKHIYPDSPEIEQVISTLPGHTAVLIQDAHKADDGMYLHDRDVSKYKSDVAKLVKLGLAVFVGEKEYPYSYKLTREGLAVYNGMMGTQYFMNRGGAPKATWRHAK